MRATRLTRIAIGACGLIWLAAPAEAGAQTVEKDSTDTVPMDIRDIIEDAISPKLVLPETARWDFQSIAPYPGGDKVVCGRVDYQSSARQYVGFHRFYAVMDGTRINTLQLEDPPTTDVSGQQAAKFRMLCDKH